MLVRFGRWFPSARGVWQTAIVVMAWWTAEFIGLIHDPQHIELCVWLTIYSAITQPVLGYVNKGDNRVSEAKLDSIAADERAELELLRKGRADV